MEYRYIRLEGKDYAFLEEEVARVRMGELDSFKTAFLLNSDCPLVKENSRPIKENGRLSRLTMAYIIATSRDSIAISSL